VPNCFKNRKFKKMNYIWQYPNWTDFKWDDKTLLKELAQARLAQGKLITRFQSLGMRLIEEAQGEILAKEAMKTAEIEGLKLDPDSVRSSVASRLGLPTAGLPSPGRDIEGLVDVLLDATRNYNQPLTMTRLKSWQAALFPTGYSGLSKIRTGQWRGPDPMQVVSSPLGHEVIHSMAPPHNNLPSEIKTFLTWWKSSLLHMEGLIRAGIAHFYFVTIHPFEDGNGRIARALTDMALAQDEKSSLRIYSLSNRIMEERKDYYDVLEICQKSNGDITPWLLWFLGSFKRAVTHSNSLIANIFAKAEFWSVHAQSNMNDRQKKVVNRILSAGKGGFEEGLTTKKYVSMAKTSRATAFREIADLVMKKMLVQNPSKGRNTSYDINWP